MLKSNQERDKVLDTIHAKTFQNYEINIASLETS